MPFHIKCIFGLKQDYIQKYIIRWQKSIIYLGKNLIRTKISRNTGPFYWGPFLPVLPKLRPLRPGPILQELTNTSTNWPKRCEVTKIPKVRTDQKKYEVEKYEVVKVRSDQKTLIIRHFTIFIAWLYLLAFQLVTST